MSSGATAQDPAWKQKEQQEETRYVREKEQAQLAALRDSLKNSSQSKTASEASGTTRDFEGGFGGQEDLEDRYATTSGEH